MKLGYPNLLGSKSQNWSNRYWFSEMRRNYISYISYNYKINNYYSNYWKQQSFVLSKELSINFDQY